MFPIYELLLFDDKDKKVYTYFVSSKYSDKLSKKGKELVWLGLFDNYEVLSIFKTKEFKEYTNVKKPYCEKQTIKVKSIILDEFIDFVIN